MFIWVENDFVRQSSGKNLSVAEAEEGRWEEEGLLLEDLSRTVRHSQRQEGQKPLKFSSGWRSQLKDELVGCCGGGGVVGSAAVGFITVGNLGWHCPPDHITTA
ncbi:Uncharacterized protein Fot_50726 [Forsythia ovata]|uniref:Uncharacterized protein n=1 Tax=Forsythia ovata TaxID=205694 RepID=A0ABD1PZ46_9LAMI